MERESGGRVFAQDTASGFPITTACPKTGHGGPAVQWTGIRERRFAAPSLSPLLSGVVGRRGKHSWVVSSS